VANLNKKLSVDERNNKAFIAILGRESSKAFKLEDCGPWYIISCLMLKNVGDLLDARPGFMRFSFVIKKGSVPTFDPFSKLNEIADSYYEKSSDSVALTVKAHDFDSKIKSQLPSLNCEVRNMNTTPRTGGGDIGFIGIQDPKDAYAKFLGNGSRRLWSYELNYLVSASIVAQIAKLPGFLPLDGPLRIRILFRDFHRLKEVRIDNRPQKKSDDGIYIFNEGDSLTYRYEDRELEEYDSINGDRIISISSKQKVGAGAKTKYRRVLFLISFFVMLLISGGIYYKYFGPKEAPPQEQPTAPPPTNPKPPVADTLDTNSLAPAEIAPPINEQDTITETQRSKRDTIGSNKSLPKSGQDSNNRQKKDKSTQKIEMSDGEG